MSYLFAVIQYIRSKTASIPESSTHRYAGGTAQIRLKNRMTRHESRRSSPKVTGPSVPDANLRKSQSLRAGERTQARERNARQDVHIGRHPYEEYFNEMRLCPILDGDRMDSYQVAGARMRFAVFRKALTDQVDHPYPTYGTHLAPQLPRSRASAKETE